MLNKISNKHSAKRTSLVTRRDLMRAGSMGVAAGLLPAGAATAAVTPDNGHDASASVYTRIGVRPFINLKAAYTIDGGLLTLPEVKQAMEDASFHSVNLDELMAKVGPRIAQLFGAEYAIVSSGGAASLTLATAACVAGGNSERIQFLPHPEKAGMKHEVIMPRASRNEYDHAIRAVGVTVINVDTAEQFRAALGPRTAMVAVLGSAQGSIPLKQMIEEAHRAGVPVLVDASPEVPLLPNPYISAGVDLVGYSGGKYLAGPQCTGVVIGRKDLVQAAWVNSSPHHGLNRTMKVGKEEIMGALAAVETFFAKRSYKQDVALWNGWLTTIAQRVADVPSVKAKLLPPPGVNPHPRLNIEWNPEKIPVTAGELHKMFLEGEPRLMTHAEGEGYSFIVRAAGMKPGDDARAGDRIRATLMEASRRPKRTFAAPAANVAGSWNVEIRYHANVSQHKFQLETSGPRVTGMHAGEFVKGKISGVIDGNKVELTSELPYDSIKLPYAFTGTLSGNTMSGEVDLDEHGMAQWRAVKG